MIFRFHSHTGIYDFLHGLDQHQINASVSTTSTSFPQYMPVKNHKLYFSQQGQMIKVV